MSTLKEIVREIIEQEKIDPEPGAWPIMFKNDWVKIQFVLLLRWEHFKIKVQDSQPIKIVRGIKRGGLEYLKWKIKRLCHL